MPPARTRDDPCARPCPAAPENPRAPVCPSPPPAARPHACARLQLPHRRRRRHCHRLFRQACPPPLPRPLRRPRGRARLPLPPRRRPAAWHQSPWRRRPQAAAGHTPRAMRGRVELPAGSPGFVGPPVCLQPRACVDSGQNAAWAARMRGLAAAAGLNWSLTPSRKGAGAAAACAGGSGHRRRPVVSPHCAPRRAARRQITCSCRAQAAPARPVQGTSGYKWRLSARMHALLAPGAPPRRRRRALWRRSRARPWRRGRPQSATVWPGPIFPSTRRGHSRGRSLWSKGATDRRNAVHHTLWPLHAALNDRTRRCRGPGTGLPLIARPSPRCDWPRVLNAAPRGTAPVRQQAAPSW